MADIIAKIGKYFADQESQMREMYVQAAATAAVVSPPAKTAAKALVAPSRAGEKDDANGFEEEVVERPPSLLRQRLLATTSAHHHVDAGVKGEKRSHAAALDAAKGSRARESNSPDEPVASAWTSRSDGDKSSEHSGHSGASSSEVALSSGSAVSSSRKLKVVKKKKKLKKKKPSEKSEDDGQQQSQKRQQLELTAEEGLARAQERARRIQMEKLLQQKQQQQEREANAARLQEEMRKIEEIRQKGKQFALRLRPQSAPSTPQSSQTALSSARRNEAEKKETLKVEHEAKRAFLSELEREMHDQMMLELVVNERAHRKHSQEQQEWARLQAQIKRTTDRNDIRGERVRSLNEKKKQLENQIEHAQSEAMRCRQERHQLEEKSKKERLQKQREAEREIHARLRKEESHRLVEEERKQSDEAADARAKAKLRVQSRASLLKRVLHGCDVRAERIKSQNQEEAMDGETNTAVPATAKSTVSPELAEFEEDGIFEDFSTPPVDTGVVSTSTKQIHDILHKELLINVKDD